MSKRRRRSIETSSSTLHKSAKTAHTRKRPSKQAAPIATLTPRNIISPRPWLKDGRFVIRLDKEETEIKPGDCFYKDSHLPFLVEQVSVETGELKVRRFERLVNEPEGGNVPFLLGGVEYILILTGPPQSWDWKDVRRIGNRALMLPWQQYASGDHHQRTTHLYCRFVRARTGGLNATFYDCCGDDFKPRIGPSVEDWSYCACARRHPLDLDLGWSYCKSCNRSTQDQCLENEEGFLREAKQDRTGVIEIVSKADLTTQQACCPYCKEGYTTEADRPNTLVQFGHLEPNPSLPHCYIALDAGTEGYRMSAQSPSIEEGGSAYRKFPSGIFIPKGTTDVQGVRVGVESSGQLGTYITPIKALILDEASFDLDFSQNELLIKIFGEMSKSFTENFLGLEAWQGKPWEQFREEHNTRVATAFPARFDPTQRSNFITGMHQAYPGARLLALSEPVAAFHYIVEQRDRDPGVYLIFDIGATTLDVAWLHVEPLRGSKTVHDIKIIHDLGLKLGADYAERKTYEVLQADQDPAYAVFNWRAVREYGDGYKRKAENRAYLRGSSGTEVGPIYSRHWAEFLQKMVEQLQTAFEEACEPGSMTVKQDNANVRIGCTTVRAAFACGGGCASEPVRQCIEQVLSERNLHKRLECYQSYEQTSCVSQGLKRKLERMIESPLLHSPVTLCFEQQTRNTSNYASRTQNQSQDTVLSRNVHPHIRESPSLESDFELSALEQDDATIASDRGLVAVSPDPDTELVALILQGQALHGTKLLNAQGPPDRTIFFDTDLDPQQDSLLKFKASFTRPKLVLNANRYLVVEAPQRDLFYNCAEVRISKENWSNSSAWQKALTAMQIKIDMDAGVVTCVGILYSLVEWTNMAIQQSNKKLDDLIDDEIACCENLTLHQIQKRAKVDPKITVHAEFDLAGCLNLNESNRQSSRFQ